jgi:ATP/maltotriose-dependent transcriptional regulator MalT
MYGESVAILEKLGAKNLLTTALMGLSTVAWRRDQLPLAQSQVERAAALSTEISDSEGLVDAEIQLAGILVERGNLAAASDTMARLETALQSASPESFARAAVLRATLSLSNGSLQAGRASIEEATRRSKEGYGAATSVALQLASARLQSAAGARTAGLAAAREVMDRSRMRGLLAFELEAGLAVAEISRDPRLATEVARRATSAKFALVARKASRLSTIGVIGIGRVVFPDLRPAKVG